MIGLKTEKEHLISDTNFIVVDFETTGLNPVNNRITEIGIAHVLDGRIVDEFDTLVNPGQFIPSCITELTGITNEMVYDKPPFEDALHKIKEYLEQNTNFTVFAGHNVAFDYKFLTASVMRTTGEKLELPTLCTCRLARRLNKSLLSKSLYSLSRHFRIKVKRRHRALDDARATAEILIHFLKTLKDEYGIEEIHDALSFQHKKIYEKDRIPSNIKRIKSGLKKIPPNPGVYKMLGKNGEILYIGKAKNLHDRVNSYFYHNTSHTGKVRKLIRQVRKVEFELTGSELSALILESRLIKLHKPHFNSAIKRYRRYPFIKLDIKKRFPKIEKTYEVKLDGARYYGPFRSSFTADSLLERIDKTFYLRKCKPRDLETGKDKSVCMYHDIGQCKAPCNNSQTHADYMKEVKRVVSFLESEASPGALKSLETKMHILSDEMNYEEASHIRDRLDDLRKVLMNMELTNSEMNTQNYVVKCSSNSAEKRSRELFFVAAGKLLKSVVIDGDKYDYENEYLKDMIENIYFRGNLFSSALYNISGKLTREDLDKMKIISNWIYLNNSPKTLLKIDGATKTEKVVEFVIDC